MRVAFALAVALGAAPPIAAQAADGPISGVIERAFGRTTKKAPEPPPAPAETQRPAPLALADGFARGRPEAPEPAPLPPPPSRYRAAVAPPYQLHTPQTPLPLQMAARAAPVAAAVLPPSSPTVAPAPPAVAPPVQPRPVALAPTAAPRPVPPPQRLAAAPRSSGGAPRLYSVHRGYGLEPDAIPEPPAGDRYVLIGPAESGVGAQAAGLDDDAPDAGPGAF